MKKLVNRRKTTGWVLIVCYLASGAMASANGFWFSYTKRIHEEIKYITHPFNDIQLNKTGLFPGYYTGDDSEDGQNYRIYAYPDLLESGNTLFVKIPDEVLDLATLRNSMENSRFDRPSFIYAHYNVFPKGKAIVWSEDGTSVKGDRESMLYFSNTFNWKTSTDRRTSLQAVFKDASLDEPKDLLLLVIHTVPSKQHWNSMLYYFGTTSDGSSAVLVADDFSFEELKYTPSQNKVILNRMKYIVSVPVDILLTPLYAVAPFFMGTD